MKESHPAPTIMLEDIFLRFQNETVFSQFNLTLRASKWTCLLGQSGIGKTTLLQLIAGLIPLNKNITLRGKIVCDPPISLTHHIAYLAQTDLLLPWADALHNAILHCQLKGCSSQEKKIILTRAKELFARMGLSHVMHLLPHQLSGGMRQRVALIRTLLQDKPIILMDEPFSSCDTVIRYQLQSLSANLLRDKTVLFITHDPMEALRLADDIYVLLDKPAKISEVISLHSDTPRSLDNKELQTQYSLLMQKISANFQEAIS